MTRGTPAASSTFRFSGSRTSSSVLAEQLLHQQLGRHGARARHQDQAHRPRRTRRAHRPADDSFFGSSSSAIRSIRRRLRHLVGDLGDHDLVLAVAQLLALASARAGGSCRGRCDRPRPRSASARPARRRSAGRALGRVAAGPRPCGSGVLEPAVQRARRSSSPALCGGIAVAMPTAMPVVPLASRLGNAAGRTTGSSSLPS